jgi:hypothetical protein
MIALRTIDEIHVFDVSIEDLASLI